MSGPEPDTAVPGREEPSGWEPAGSEFQDPGKIPRWTPRALGAGILLLTLAPLHLLLRQSPTGRFGQSAVLRNASNLEMAWWGLVLACGAGAVLTILISTRRIRSFLGHFANILKTISLPKFAIWMGILATILALFSGLGLFRGFPTLVDGMITRLQARTLAHGLLALDPPAPPAAWLLPNTVLTAEGWVSQYPPFPAFLLALGEIARVPWLVYPLLVGVTVVFSTLLAGRLFPGDPTRARLSGLLLAGSPFLLFLGGGYLSHVPAAAFSAITLYAAVRAVDGGWGWAVLVGAGSGAAVSCRPFLGLVLGVLLPTVFWTRESRRIGTRRWLPSRFALAFAGGIPFAWGLGLYNRYFFGSPVRFGYSAAFGPGHDLGFHVDPWGNLYSPLEALAFSAVDLVGLGVYLLETPIPVTTLVGLWLLLSRSLPRGERFLLAWALLPVLGNFFYWHHGFHLGPRMLYEAAPAWIILGAGAALSLSTPTGDLHSGLSGPVDPHPGEGVGERGASPRSRRLADLALWSLLVSVPAAGFLVVNRAASYQWTTETLARVSPPEPEGDQPALVFVHGSWSERTSARLQASGMRLDRIETAIRRNDICLLHTFATARAAVSEEVSDTSPGLSDLDLKRVAESPSSLTPAYLSEGNRVLVDPGRPFSPQCRREAQADRNGIISLAPLLWQGDLPGVEVGRPMFVRDLGPEENAPILERFPDRRPHLLMIPSPGAKPAVLDYREGMEILWGGTPS